MKRIAALLSICAMIVLSGSTFGANKATKSQKKAPAAASDKEYVAPPTSTYCMEHPSQCKAKDPDARPAMEPYDNCVDVYGNGDGFVSEWEVNNFGERCR